MRSPAPFPDFQGVRKSLILKGGVTPPNKINHLAFDGIDAFRLCKSLILKGGVTQANRINDLRNLNQGAPTAAVLLKNVRLASYRPACRKAGSEAHKSQARRHRSYPPPTIQSENPRGPVRKTGPRCIWESEMT